VVLHSGDSRQLAGWIAGPDVWADEGFDSVAHCLAAVAEEVAYVAVEELREGWELVGCGGWGRAVAEWAGCRSSTAH
jgi:hypothetical protein